MAKKWKKSGVYKYKEQVLNGAQWWKEKGYLVRIVKLSDGWYHYRQKK